jgi:Lhr-like helicase
LFIIFSSNSIQVYAIIEQSIDKSSACATTMKHIINNYLLILRSTEKKEKKKKKKWSSKVVVVSNFELYGLWVLSEETGLFSVVLRPSGK